MCWGEGSSTRRGRKCGWAARRGKVRTVRESGKGYTAILCTNFIVQLFISLKLFAPKSNCWRANSVYCGPCLLKQQGHLSPLPFPSSLSHPAELRNSFMFQTKANGAKHRALDPQQLDLLEDWPTHTVAFSLYLSSNPCSLASVPTTRWRCSCWNHQRPRAPAPWVLFCSSATWPFNSTEQCWPHLLLEISTSVGFDQTLDFPLGPLSLLCHLFIPHLTQWSSFPWLSVHTLPQGSHSFPALKPPACWRLPNISAA